MRASLFIIIISLLTLFSCHEQRKDDGQTYNTEYVVGTIPLADDFLKLNENEKAIDSIFDDGDKSVDSIVSVNPKYKENNLIHKNDFGKNRGRVLRGDLGNANREPGDSSISMPCNCTIEKDTLFVKMIIGFFGGIGFDIELFGNNFRSGYSIYIDDVKPFKSDLADTAFYDYAHAKSKFQHLVVDKKPTYKQGQQLTGYLTFTTNNYYIKHSDGKLDSSYATGKLYFTCETRQKTDRDR